MAWCVDADYGVCFVSKGFAVGEWTNKEWQVVGNSRVMGGVNRRIAVLLDEIPVLADAVTAGMKDANPVCGPLSFDINSNSIQWLLGGGPSRNVEGIAEQIHNYMTGTYVKSEACAVAENDVTTLSPRPLAAAPPAGTQALTVDLHQTPATQSASSSYGAEPADCMAMVGFNQRSAGNDAVALSKLLHTACGIPTFCTGTWCPAHPGLDWREPTADGADNCKIFIALITGDAKEKGRCWQRSENTISEFKNLIMPRWERGDCKVVPVFYPEGHQFATEYPDPSKLLRWIGSIQRIDRGQADWMEQVARACAAAVPDAADTATGGFPVLICCCDPEGMLEAATEETDALSILCPNSAIITNASVREFKHKMHSVQPSCLVFIGHGDVPLRGDLMLGFVGENGDTEIVDPMTIAKILEPHKSTLQVVLLNGCTTIDLAKGLHEKVGIPHVVGWSSPVVDEAAKIFSCAFFKSLDAECSNVKQAYDSACLAVQMETEPDESGRLVQKYELEDPLNRALVDHTEFPHRLKANGRIAAGNPIRLSHDDLGIRDWLLLAPSMNKLSKELVMFKEPVNQENLHICDHCPPLRAVEGEEYKKLMDLKTTMDSLEDVEMQKRRFNIGALHDETAETETQGSFDADEALLALEVSLAAVLGPAACGKTTTMHKLAYRLLQMALKNPWARIPILVHVYRLTAMLKHLQQRHGTSVGGDGRFDLTKCDLLMEFVADTSGYGLGICEQGELEAYRRLLNGELGNQVCCIFDGLDEGGQYKDEIEMYIKRLASRQHMHVIVSSRETGFDHTHFGGSLDKLFQILPLTSAMKRDVIGLRLEQGQDPPETHEANITSLHEQIQQKFLELSRNPLLLSLLIVNYNKKRKQQSAELLPRNRFELYKDGTELMMNTYRKRAFKGLVSQSQEQKASALLDDANAASGESAAERAAERRAFFQRVATTAHAGRGRDIVSIMVEGREDASACLAATANEELRLFLVNAGLHPKPEGLEDSLVHEGAETANCLLLLDEEDFDDIVKGRIHRKKLKRAIEELRKKVVRAGAEAPVANNSLVIQEELEAMQDDPEATKMFNTLVHERCGLMSLIAREVDPQGGEERRIYRFPHLTFQEYFASEQMIEDIEKDLEGKEGDAVHEVFEKHLGKDNESKLYDVWYREIVLFITCGLSSGAFEKLVDFLLSTDDGIGAVQTRVHQMMKERGMIDSDDPVVMVQRQQIYARISQTRTTEFMAMALMHPAPSLQELALTELREYKMDGLSIAKAILAEVKQATTSDCCKAAGLRSIGLLDYASTVDAKGTIVSELVAIWMGTEVGSEYASRVKEEAGTAVAALKAHTSQPVLDALCGRLRGGDQTSVEEAIDIMESFDLQEKESKVPGVAEAMMALIARVCSSMLRGRVANAITNWGWTEFAFKRMDRIYTSDPSYGLILLGDFIGKGVFAEGQGGFQYAVDKVLLHLQEKIQDTAVTTRNAVDLAITHVEFLHIAAIRESLIALCSQEGSSDKLNLQVLPVLTTLKSFEEEGESAVEALVLMSQLGMLRNGSTKDPLHLQLDERTQALKEAEAARLLPAELAAEMVRELEAKPGESLKAVWLRVMVQCLPVKEALAKIVEILRDSTSDNLRLEALETCEPGKVSWQADDAVAELNSLWADVQKEVLAVWKRPAAENSIYYSRLRKQALKVLVAQFNDDQLDYGGVLTEETLQEMIQTILVAAGDARSGRTSDFAMQLAALDELKGPLAKHKWCELDRFKEPIVALIEQQDADSAQRERQISAIELLPSVNKATRDKALLSMLHGCLHGFPNIAITGQMKANIGSIQQALSRVAPGANVCDLSMDDSEIMSNPEARLTDLFATVGAPNVSMVVIAFDCKGIRLPLVGEGGRLQQLLEMLLARGVPAERIVFVGTNEKLAVDIGFDVYPEKMIYRLGPDQHDVLRNYLTNGQFFAWLDGASKTQEEVLVQLLLGGGGGGGLMIKWGHQEIMQAAISMACSTNFDSASSSTTSQQSPPVNKALLAIANNKDCPDTQRMVFLAFRQSKRSLNTAEGDAVLCLLQDKDGDCQVRAAAVHLLLQLGTEPHEVTAILAPLWEECVAQEKRDGLFSAVLDVLTKVEAVAAEPRVVAATMQLHSQIISSSEQAPSPLLTLMSTIEKWLRRQQAPAAGTVSEEAEAKRRGNASAAAECFVTTTTSLATATIGQSSDVRISTATNARRVLNTFGETAGLSETNVIIAAMLDNLADPESAPFLFAPLLAYFRRQRDAFFEERAKQSDCEETGWNLSPSALEKLQLVLHKRKSGDGYGGYELTCTACGLDFDRLSQNMFCCFCGEPRAKIGGVLEATFLMKDLKVGKFCDGSIPYWKGRKIKAPKALLATAQRQIPPTPNSGAAIFADLGSTTPERTLSIAENVGSYKELEALVERLRPELFRDDLLALKRIAERENSLSQPPGAPKNQIDVTSDEHHNEGKQKLLEATTKGVPYLTRRDLAQLSARKFEAALQDGVSKDREDRARDLLSYARYGAGFCSFRLRDYADARQHFDLALVGRGLSDHTADLARKFRVYCVYTLGKKAMREGRLEDAQKEFAVARFHQLAL
jgi:hypothetical protein